MNTTEIERIKRGSYEQVHANTQENLKEMKKFLETCKLPRLNQEEIGNMNRSITSKKTDSVIKTSPKKPRTKWLHW